MATALLNQASIGFRTQHATISAKRSIKGMVMRSFRPAGEGRKSLIVRANQTGVINDSNTLRGMRQQFMQAAGITDTSKPIFDGELYYSPTSCGAANYISAYKAGLVGTKVNTTEVVVKTHIINSGPNKGMDFYKINPKGNVPTVVLPGGAILNENVVTLQWIADQNPSAELAPPYGTVERYELVSKLSYVGTEVHASAGPLFNPSLSPETREFMLNRLKTKLKFLSEVELENGQKTFIYGNKFTIVDSYLYIVLTWMTGLGVDLATEFPVMKRYLDNIANLDFVKESHAAMAAAK